MNRPARAASLAAAMADHPILGGLRVVREPRPRVMVVVEALCRPRELATSEDMGKRNRLPTDSEISKETGLSMSAVRTAIDDMALLLDGLEMLETRARIYVWYRHTQWVKGEP